MADSIMVIGDIGTGKTASLRNLDPKEHFYINCDTGKRLTFPKAKQYKTVLKNPKNGTIKDNIADDCNMVVTTQFRAVAYLMKYVSDNMPHIKVLTIDTISSIMTHEFMTQAKMPGWEKFTDQALNTWKTITSVPSLREDLMVVFIAHSETDKEGKRDFFTPGGKLIAEKAKPAAQYSLILETFVERSSEKDVNYFFKTQNDGFNIARSPMGMFDNFLIPNDLNEVINIYNKYYN